ncbi:hypothetical protein [Morganella morganii]|uniref:hypothetical protein n=1 Tax=Morganella morganii TaxID=582 RepID=UPI000BFE70B3|nr:hypothetical protein [Morganella morganii]PHH11214.1 hypothetical protein CRX48_01015 [Morganella morganii]
MPIIKDNLISLEHDGIAWQVSCVRHPEISVWDGCENYNDNFYRKAMELFLLMKDAENEKVEAVTTLVLINGETYQILLPKNIVALQAKQALAMAQEFGGIIVPCDFASIKQ